MGAPASCDTRDPPLVAVPAAGRRQSGKPGPGFRLLVLGPAIYPAHMLACMRVPQARYTPVLRAMRLYPFAAKLRRMFRS